MGTAWGKWMQKYAPVIVLSDGLKRTDRLMKAGLVSDGPCAESKEIIASFTVIQSDDYDSALAIGHECPGYDGSLPGYSIEIREMFGYA